VAVVEVEMRYEFDPETMTLTYGGSLLATLHTSDDFPCAEDDNGVWDENQRQFGEYLAEHLNAGYRALDRIANQTTNKENK
jgi:hypothetical protein